MKLFHDEADDRLRLRGDDLKTLVHLDVLKHHINHHGFDHQTENAEQAGFRPESDQREQRDQKIADHQADADVERRELPQNHRDDVCSAAGRFKVKENGAADGGQRDREDQLQQRLRSERLTQRQRDFQQPRRAAHHNAAIRRAQPKPAAEEGKPDQQQQLVNDEHVGGGADARKVTVQDDGKPAYAAGGKVVGKLEKVNADGNQQRSQRQQQIIPRCGRLSGRFRAERGALCVTVVLHIRLLRQLAVYSLIELVLLYAVRWNERSRSETLH